jgi:chromosome condensin MukBEF MukE localization factor
METQTLNKKVKNFLLEMGIEFQGFEIKRNVFTDGFSVYYWNDSQEGQYQLINNGGELIQKYNK